MPAYLPVCFRSILNISRLVRNVRFFNKRIHRIDTVNWTIEVGSTHVNLPFSYTIGQGCSTSKHLGATCPTGCNSRGPHTAKAALVGLMGPRGCMLHACMCRWVHPYVAQHLISPSAPCQVPCITMPQGHSKLPGQELAVAPRQDPRGYGLNP